MAHYKHIKYASLALLSLCMSVNAFASADVLSSQNSLEEKRGSIAKKICLDHEYAAASSSSSSPALLSSAPSKKDLLLAHLPLQIEAVQKLQGKFQSEIDSQRGTNQLAAFRAACGLANLQSFSSSIKDVLSCLRSADQSMVYIGIGAAPALKPGMDQILVYLGESGGQLDSFKALAAEFQKIIGDIPNPEFPADSIL